MGVVLLPFRPPHAELITQFLKTGRRNVVAYDPSRHSRDTLRLLMEGTAKNGRSHRSEPSAQNERGEHATFENALRKVVSVSHTEVKAKVDAEKTQRTSSRAVNGKR